MATDAAPHLETPMGVTDQAGHPAWGSDVVLDMLRLLGIEYAAVLPGSSFRGIHDSAVNYTANRNPQFILVNHEMLTVAIARGYALATGKPMAAIVHNFVGLLNTGMTIYDAWVDRVPVLVLGGTGPVDATKRRPRIDWIHTAQVQGSMFRDFTKWDDEPRSVEAVPESMLRAYRMAMTAPRGPVYLCYDVELQEQPLVGPISYPDVSRYRPAPTPAPDRSSVREAARLLVGAEMPLCFAEHVGSHPEAVRALVVLAELLAMPVINGGARFSFPSPHALDFFDQRRELLGEADLILGLEPADLAGNLVGGRGVARGRRDGGGSTRKIINVSMDELLHRGFTTEYQALPAVDVPILSDSGTTLPHLIEEVRSQLDSASRNRIEQRRQALEARQAQIRERQRRFMESEWNQLSEARMVAELWNAVKDEDYVFTGGRVSWMAPGVLEIPGPERNVVGIGVGTVGVGPGVALGAALGLRSQGKLPVAVFGDGDFLMSNQSLWTAAHYRIPSLWVLKNNRSYYNDEFHQDEVARTRERPVENKVVAMRMEDPAVDFAAMARSFGCGGEGPITKPEELAPAFRRAVDEVKRGHTVLVDVRVENRAGG